MDVVERRCKVVEGELNTLTKILSTVIQSIKDIKSMCDNLVTLGLY